ncbi:hypothetical protein [Bacteriovorax sp. Seq25_V]|uniref:hypothetical protein n=1 Tax=Bacteriovorax sp. Seq25_V TaxID=1201288 RepID=UPI00038A0E69|nr:hypothetical protein [Bacteriovorax sp. Seq25_V]EQC46134.1 hypothetical protein M900_1734 [Bacteriovorax sp. Seq25_V]
MKFLLLIFFILSSCALYTDKSYKNSPVLTANYFTEKKLIIDAKNSVESFIASWRQENGIKEDILSSRQIRTEAYEIERIFNGLPLDLKRFLELKVEKFIIVDKLGVSQFVHQLKNKKFLVFIDSRINSLGINDWYKHREYSALNKTKSDITMEPYLGHGNLKTDTIQFVLAQTIALIISTDERFFPQNFETIESFQKDSFISESWIINNGIISSKWQKYLSEIKFISFYGQSSRTINFDKVYEFYQLLERTNFVNLYASSSPLRDFVESIAGYIHYKYFKKPFHIEFYEKEILLDSFSSCIVNERCIGKRQKIEKMLKSSLFPLVTN